MHNQVASVEDLLERLRAGPLGREQELVAVPERDPDRVARAGLAFVGHRHLQGEVPAEGNRGERVRHVCQVRLRPEVGQSVDRCIRRIFSDPQRVDRRALDLIGAAALPEDDVDVALAGSSGSCS